MTGGKRIWKAVEDIKSKTDDFNDLGKAFLDEKKDVVSASSIGQARSQLFPQRELVDFAVKWMEKNRKK
jgi:aminoglycoside 3-N-acetyltransferase